MPNLVLVEAIATKILVIRGKKVLLDKDLAQLYGVETRVLNQAVKRNIIRFPGGLYVFSNKGGDYEDITICDILKVL